MAVGTRRGVDALAGVLRIIGLAIVTVLVAHIVLTLLDANPANTFATVVRNLADFFNLGLSDLFLLADPKLKITLNYGVAALIWLVITTLVVRLIRRIG
ncbi:MAG: hypothetical protein ACRDRH_01660 [Pseudonocardia sp.]